MECRDAYVAIQIAEQHLGGKKSPSINLLNITMKLTPLCSQSEASSNKPNWGAVSVIFIIDSLFARVVYSLTGVHGLHGESAREKSMSK